MPGPPEVSDFGLLPRQPLPCAPVEVADSGLLQWRLLFQACSGGGCLLRPVSVDVPVLDLFLQRSLTWA